MRFKYVFVIVSLSSFFIFLALANLDTKEETFVPIKKEESITQYKAMSTLNEIHQLTPELCPKDANFLLINLDKFEQKKRKLHSLFSGYYSTLDSVSTEEKELHIQLAGINIDTFRKNHIALKNKNFSLLDPTIKPVKLKNDVFNLIMKNTILKNYEQIANLALNGKITNRSVYREKSILSHIVSTDKNIQRSDIELIVSSGLTISFIDIINSVKANISPDILDYLMSNYTDDLNELWFEDYSYNSLATLAVKENNISLFRIIQRHGVTLQTKENDKTALDFLAIPNNESDRQAAQEILSILAIANIRPYQIDKIQEIKSWLPSNILKTHISYFSDVESYINQKINSTSDIEDDMYEELKPHLQTLSHKIAQIKNTIKNCSISIHEPTSDTETTSNLHKESSTSESEQLSANQKSQLIDMQIMLSEKKWEHYIDSLESFINEYNMPEYRSFALPILIQNSGPPHVLKEVIENGNVIVFPETITLAILKNDVESLKLILPLSHNIKLTEINQFLESNGSSEAVSDEIKNLFEQRKLKMGTE